MTKTLDYTLGVLFVVFICLLWFLQYFQITGFNFIAIGTLILFVILYRCYINQTQFLYLARLLMIPLFLWFVTAKDSLITAQSLVSITVNLLVFLGVLLCCIRALLNYIHIEKAPASL